ncbi:MAG: M36 family metallopeptidase [Micromonosporaceae bacterium]
MDHNRAPDKAAQAAAERRGLSVRWDPGTGLPRQIRSSSGVLARTTGDRGPAALKYLDDNRDVFGLSRSDTRSVVVTKTYTDDSGITYVYLSQRDGSRRVFGSGAIATFDGSGALVAVAGRLYPQVGGGPAAIGAEAAALHAAKSVGRTSSQAPQRKGEDAKGRVRMTNPYAAGLANPLDIVAEQVTVRTLRGDRPAWLLDLDVDPVSWYEMAVDAQSGQILYRQNRYSFSGPEGTVWTSQNPTTTRSIQPFTGWVGDRATSGNNANVYEDRDGNNASDYQTQTPASGDPNYQHFNYGFTNAWETNANGTAASLNTDRDAILTQYFYWQNWTHDVLYSLGFNEASGNFQVDNFGRGGTGGDAVQAEAFDSFNTGSSCNANFGTNGDGTAARMQVFVGDGSSATCPYRLSELEGDTIVHETGHGVFTRLINGGGGEGSGVQTGGMDEGIGDFLASSFFDDPVVFEWDSNNASTGLRRVRYDTSTWTLDDVCNNGCEVHNDGEIWATALWDLRELMIARYGGPGRPRAERLALDGMRSTPSSADFLDGRDGILTRDAAAGSPDRCLIWAAFTRTGMGVSATVAANQTTVTEATDVPAECRPTAQAGGPYTTPEGTDVTLNGGGSTKGSHASAGAIATYQWDLDNDGQYDDATGATPTFSNVGNDASFTVGLQVTDAYGVTATATSTVTVTNVAPTVTLQSISSTPENSAITLTGVISDPGWLDPLTATVNWGDGAGAQGLSGTLENTRPNATLSFSTSHTYGDDGSFTIQVCGSDDDTTTCNSVVAVITNVDPTAAISAAGQTTYNGQQAFIAHAGQAIDVTGSSTDPGSDDLTLTWAWGDGTSSSLTSLVNAPATDPDPSPSSQPRDVTGTRSHTYADACLFSLSFTSADDDNGSGSANAIVIITGNADRARSQGYWKVQYDGKPPNDFTAAQLNCFLQIASFMSSVYDGLTPVQAYAILSSTSSQPRPLLSKQLLAAWLNFANGSYDLGTPVDTDGDGSNDSTFGAAVATAEAVYNNASASKADLLVQQKILERINLRDGG